MITTAALAMTAKADKKNMQVSKNKKPQPWTLNAKTSTFKTMKASKDKTAARGNDRESRQKKHASI